MEHLSHRNLVIYWKEEKKAKRLRQVKENAKANAKKKKGEKEREREERTDENKNKYVGYIHM